MESELLHTYSKVDPFDALILCVRVAVLTAVTLTVPIVLFPVSQWAGGRVARPTGGGTDGADGRMTLPQVRRAIQQMMFQSQEEFSWLRHVLIAICLLTCINLLVIFAPNILGIFGIIGESLALLGVAPENFPSANPGRLLSSYPTVERWLLAMGTTYPPVWDFVGKAIPIPSEGSEPLSWFPLLGHGVEPRGQRPPRRRVSSLGLVPISHVRKLKFRVIKGVADPYS